MTAKLWADKIKTCYLIHLVAAGGVSCSEKWPGQPSSAQDSQKYTPSLGPPFCDDPPPNSVRSCSAKKLDSKRNLQPEARTLSRPGSQFGDAYPYESPPSPPQGVGSPTRPSMPLPAARGQTCHYHIWSTHWLWATSAQPSEHARGHKFGHFPRSLNPTQPLDRCMGWRPS